VNKRDRERRKAANIRINEKWAEWSIVYSLAHTRAPGLAKNQLFDLLKALLLVNGTVSRGMLIDAHRATNMVAFKVAQAEVDVHTATFAEALRRDGMPLVHPLTEEGLMYAATVDGTDTVQVARCVPGLGGAGPTAAWRIADRSPTDPVFAAYINHRNLSGVRAVERAYRLADAGVTAGVIAPIAPLPLLERQLIKP
jgi:hypothetical protein